MQQIHKTCHSLNAENYKLNDSKYLIEQEMCYSVTNVPKDMMRTEVKVTVTQRQYVTFRYPKVYPHTKFGIPTSKKNWRYVPDMIFLELRPEIKVQVTVTRK